MCTPEEALVKATTEIAKEAVSAPIREFLQKLTGPWVEQIGLSFGDAGQVYRFKRAVRLLEKVKKIADDAGFHPQAIQPRLLLPIIDAASLESDEELHDRWANLLANAANRATATKVLPSFIAVLRELSPTEVQFLDWALNESLRVQEEVLENIAEINLSREAAALHADLPIPHNGMDMLNSAQIGNLQRLGLAEWVFLDKSPVRPEGWDRSMGCYFTVFGREFVRACQRSEKLK